MRFDGGPTTHPSTRSIAFLNILFSPRRTSTAIRSLALNPFNNLLSSSSIDVSYSFILLSNTLRTAPFNSAVLCTSGIVLALNVLAIIVRQKTYISSGIFPEYGISNALPNLVSYYLKGNLLFKHIFLIENINSSIDFFLCTRGDYFNNRLC